MTSEGLYYDRQGRAIGFEDWALRYEDNEYKRVAFTEIGEVEVSTVWLGLDHSFTASGPPIIFETMIFGGPHDEETWRYPTEEAALIGHNNVVRRLTKDIDDG